MTGVWNNKNLASQALLLRRVEIIAICALVILCARPMYSQETSPVPPPPAASEAPSTNSAKAAVSSDKNSEPAGPGDNIRFGYTIHQALELGGHITTQSGSSAVYDTMVNLHSGPRVISQSLDMRAVKPSSSMLFDTLSSNSFGYAGDPNSLSILNASKGKIYNFRGSFRRDRQYFNYDLLDNPLIPPESSPFVPVLDSPHLFNTVRHMLDLDLTLAPISPLSVRLSYSRNNSEGPSYSTIHVGAEALLYQNWRNLTDSWAAGLDWKPLKRTTVSYDQFITQYRGDTSWQLSGLNYQLADGTPVSLGIDLSSLWASPCAAPFTSPGVVKPTCSAFLGYSRSAPTRTHFPTEQFRFQSGSIPRLALNGRLLYTGDTSHLNSFNEVFNGFEARTVFRESVVTGSASAKRVDVNGDLSVAWQITPAIEATDTFNFWDFRVPGTNSFSETDYTGTSLLQPPSSPVTTVTPDAQFINQKTKSNTFILAWDVSARTRVSLGYRYRSRIITDAGGDFIPIHEDWGLFATTLRPLPEWKINFNAEAMYADNSFTRISPRQLQHYILRSTYKPQSWLTFSGTINVRESRDNVQTVNHLEHNRDFSFGTSIAPDAKWSLDLNYGYDSVYSSTLECYASSAPPPTATAAPDVCIQAATPFASTGYYNSPTQFGSIGATWSPTTRVHLVGGYRMSAVDGNSDMINIRQVNGSLQSQYQSPYGTAIVDIAENWKWKANYNYYGYGEGSPIGPTSPRSFNGNVYTLSVNYAF